MQHVKNSDLDPNFTQKLSKKTFFFDSQKLKNPWIRRNSDIDASGSATLTLIINYKKLQAIQKIQSSNVCSFI